MCPSNQKLQGQANGRGFTVWRAQLRKPANTMPPFTALVASEAPLANIDADVGCG
jgi:hypothetical protein